MAIVLAGCFQSASEPLVPTFAVNVTAPPLATFTPVPLITTVAPGALSQPIGTLAATAADGAAASAGTPLATQDAVPGDQATVAATVPAIDNQPTVNNPPAQTDVPPTDAASVVPPSDTPFITPIATGGYVTPDNGTSLLIGTGVDGGAQPTSANPAGTAPATDNPILNTPTALPTESPCTYTVRPNDHLLGIATQVGVSLDALEAANPQLGGDPNSLQIGQVLTVPGCGQPSATLAPPTVPPTATAGTPGVTTYTVQSGDTLYVISQRYNISLASLEQANKLNDQSILQIGQVLIIPAK